MPRLWSRRVRAGRYANCFITSGVATGGRPRSWPRAPSRPPIRASSPMAEPPGEASGGLDWLVDGAALLVDAVTRTGSDRAVWTILGQRPAWWWLRRRAFDTLVHAVDAAIAQGVQHQMSSNIAAEALTEWLERVAAQADTSSPPLRPGQCLRFHASDTDGRWAVWGTEAGVTWAPEQGPGDVMLRGPMADLLLVAVRRRRLDETGITVVGDAAVWQAWLDNTPFESSQNRSMSPMRHGDKQRIRCGAPKSGHAGALTCVLCLARCRLNAFWAMRRDSRCRQLEMPCAA